MKRYALFVLMALAIAPGADALERIWEIDGDAWRLKLITVEGRHAILEDADGDRYRIKDERFSSGNTQTIRFWMSANKERVERINEARAKWQGIKQQLPARQRTLTMPNSQYAEHRESVIRQFRSQYRDVLYEVGLSPARRAPPEQQVAAQRRAQHEEDPPWEPVPWETVGRTTGAQYDPNAERRDATAAHVDAMRHHVTIMSEHDPAGAAGLAHSLGGQAHGAGMHQTGHALNNIGHDIHTRPGYDPGHDINILPHTIHTEW